MKPVDYRKIVITAQDIQDSGFCLTPGVKDWCEHYGFDFRDLIRNGITVDRVIALPDGHAQEVVAHKLKGIDDGR